MNESLTCLLCGMTDRGVERTWVRWKEPDAEGNVFGTTHRCRDRASCIRRVDANGDRWSVDDGKALK